MTKAKRQYAKILNNYTNIIIAILVVIMSIVLVVLVRGYYNKLDDKLFEERKLHLIEFTDKVTEIIDSTIDLSRRELYSCKHIITNESNEVKSSAALLDLLKSTGDFLNTETTLLLAIDQKGNYYSSDGFIGYWQDSSILLNTEDIQSIVEIPHIEEGSFLYFQLSLGDEAVTITDDIKITHLAIAVSSSSVNEQLSISGFGDECYSYIVNDSGRRLYQYTYKNNFIEGYNIFKTFSNYTVVNGGTFEEFEKDILSGTSTALEFEYVDDKTGTSREWFVANADLTGIDWHVLLFVPTDVLGANTDDLLNETTVFFVAATIILIVIFILMVFVIISGRANKMLLTQKEEANVLLAEAAERAESANIAKSDFLSRMSHDIRTPINAIIGMTGIAIKNINNKEKVNDCLFKIECSSQHLFSLLNDVLDMSRIESGKTTMASEAFNLSACLSNCASIIDGQLATRDLELIREFEDFKNPIVIGDELHLRQIFINILGNSLKFTSDGGKIYFRAKQTELNGKTAFHFEIEDTGIGMKSEFLPKLFEPFTQENSGSRTTYKGTGLGMAIVKQFVDMMNGTIDVKSTLNVGTTFIIEIPMEIDYDAQVSDDMSEDIIDLNGMRVLLVEDNELNMEIAQEILEAQGVNVTTAENGKIAADIYKNSKTGTFDAILMDVMMPIMDGLAATTVIRASGKSDAKSIPIIAMTANAYDEDVRKTMDAGMNSHLSKPIDVNKLYSTLANYYKK